MIKETFHKTLKVLNKEKALLIELKVRTATPWFRIISPKGV